MRPYDLVYDSGCFHHLPPHRRVSYRFAAGAMGSELDDAEFYRQGTGLHGGLAYSAKALCHIFADLHEVELRRMHVEPTEAPHFGEPFLWAALFLRRSERALPSGHRAGGGFVITAVASWAMAGGRWTGGSGRVAGAGRPGCPAWR